MKRIIAAVMWKSFSNHFEFQIYNHRIEFQVLSKENENKCRVVGNVGLT